VVLSDGFEQTILRDGIEKTLLKWEKRGERNRKMVDKFSPLDDFLDILIKTLKKM